MIYIKEQPRSAANMVASINKEWEMTNTENKFKYSGLIYIAVEESSCRLCFLMKEINALRPMHQQCPYVTSEAEKMVVVFASS